MLASCNGQPTAPRNSTPATAPQSHNRPPRAPSTDQGMIRPWLSSLSSLPLSCPPPPHPLLLHGGNVPDGCRGGSHPQLFARLLMAKQWRRGTKGHRPRRARDSPARAPTKPARDVCMTKCSCQPPALVLCRQLPCHINIYSNILIIHCHRLVDTVVFNVS
jgi:hypothetical protein